MTRIPLIVGNWKMNTSRREAVDLATAVAASSIVGVETVVCPPFPWLIPVGAALSGTAVSLGAQDCWTGPNGAFTGAVSPTMLAEICRYAIIGHSERRRIFHEDDLLVRQKLDAALAASLSPILCVGEDLETRQAGNAVSFVSSQLDVALADRPELETSRCTIAYEPIWAIGTGVAAGPNDAEEMAIAIRTKLAQIASPRLADGCRILYGGSVSPSNAREILSQSNVDGALVGGASLKADSFLAIVAAAV